MTQERPRRGRGKTGPTPLPRPAGVDVPAHLEGEREPDVVGGALLRLAPPPPDAEVRDLDTPELEALDAALAAFGDGIRARWEDEYLLKVVARRDLDPQRRIVVLPPGVLPVVAPFAPHLVGLPVATLSRRGARLTLEGGAIAARHATRRTVRLREKGETLFLYGRHVLAKSVARVTGPAAPGEEVLVLRETDGVYLGIGVVQPGLVASSRPRRKAPRRAEGERAQDLVALSNRTDLGRYLRDAQEVPE